MGFFERLRAGLDKTRQNFTERIAELVSGSDTIDEDFYEELEALLVMADVGVATTEKLLTAIRGAVKRHEVTKPEDVLPFLRGYVAQRLGEGMERTRLSGSPTVILVVGVNGVGKTTTIGKLGNYYSLLGK